MAGRRPKPSALRQLEGNRGHRPIPQNEPKPTGTPTCPKHLDKAARTEWKRISRELIAIGVLTSVDRAALAAYCQSWSRWVAAEEGIAKFGTVIKSPKSGFPIQSPHVGIANVALGQLRKFAVELGLTPSSRSRLTGTVGGSVADPFESFMREIGAADDIAEDAPELGINPHEHAE